MLLSGCAADGTIDRNVLGGGIGAAGGYVACQLLNGDSDECLLAAVAGAVVGVVIAKQLEKGDVEPRKIAVAEVLEGEKETTTWTSAETGNSGNIRLLNAMTDESGRECRVVEETYDKQGVDPISEKYTMCKGASGTWETVS